MAALPCKSLQVAVRAPGTLLPSRYHARYAASSIAPGARRSLSRGARATASCAAAVAVGGLLLSRRSHGPSACQGQAGIAERGLTSSSVPPFSLDRSYYGDGTYVGRVRDALALIDARLLLVTDEELEHSKKMLSDYRSGVVAEGTSDLALWRARHVVEGIIHPVTGEKMLLIGRMSAFVLVNLPIAAGMLIHGPTSTAAAVFWQWANQSMNVVCNYVNRSGASVDWPGIIRSYALAASVSCGLAFAAGQAMQSYPGLRRFGLMVPYFAVIFASTANMFLSRLTEWTAGVPVFDHEGRERGMSPRAGLEGVMRTVTTRSWLLPMPLLILPPMIMQALRAIPFMIARPSLLRVSELATIAVCLQCALPLVLALQPAKMKLKASSLEPEFWELVDSQGKGVDFLYANKGL